MIRVTNDHLCCPFVHRLLRNGVLHHICRWDLEMLMRDESDSVSRRFCWDPITRGLYMYWRSRGHWLCRGCTRLGINDTSVKCFTHEPLTALSGSSTRGGSCLTGRALADVKLGYPPKPQLYVTGHAAVLPRFPGGVSTHVPLTGFSSRAHSHNLILFVRARSTISLLLIVCVYLLRIPVFVMSRSRPSGLQILGSFPIPQMRYASFQYV